MKWCNATYCDRISIHEAMPLASFMWQSITSTTLGRKTYWTINYWSLGATNKLRNLTKSEVFLMRFIFYPAKVNKQPQLTIPQEQLVQHIWESMSRQQIRIQSDCAVGTQISIYIIYLHVNTCASLNIISSFHRFFRKIRAFKKAMVCPAITVHGSWTHISPPHYCKVPWDHEKAFAA